MSAEAEDLAAVGEYFTRRWDEYDKVVSNDYLGHRGLFAAAHRTLAARCTRAYALADLGCGDGRFSGGLVSTTPIVRYVGIDLSDTAISRARHNLRMLPCRLEFVMGDAFAPLEPDAFDVVVASFSMHHLSRPQKQAFLEALRDRLKPAGIFVLIDLVTAEGTTMEAAREAMCARVREQWTALDDAERQRVTDHISSADFIESAQWLTDAAARAGFEETQTLHLDPRGHTGCFLFGRG